MPDQQELEWRLRELGSMLDFPPTPAVARSVSARLRRRGRTPWTSALLAAALLLVVGGSVVGFTPQVRDRVAALFHLNGVTIRRVEHVPSPTPTIGPGDALSLGPATTLADARRLAGYPVLVPSILAQPDEVHINTREGIPLREVSLVYTSVGGVPPAPTTGVALLIVEFHADVDSQGIDKAVGPGTTIQAVKVNGFPGYWIEGSPHGFAFVSGGSYDFEPLRLATNTLVWDENGTTYRLEGNITREKAFAIAQSMR